MNPELKSKWIEALRSGEFKQTTGMFKKTHSDGTERFCCLGVLCVVAEENPIIFAGSNWAFADRALGRTISGSPWPDHLAAKNDGGASFAEIANYIDWSRQSQSFTAMAAQTGARIGTLSTVMPPPTPSSR